MGSSSFHRVLAAAAGVLSSVGAAAQTPAGTAFIYQGRLLNAGSPANGTYDLQCRLFDASAAGVQVGTQVCADNVTVAGGLFTVSLDFGAQFGDWARWLDIRVRPDPTAGNCAAGAYTQLTPRQAIGSAPSALFSQAPWATSGNDVSYTGGSVGIGTTTPSNRLTVSNESDNASIIAIDSGATSPQSSTLRLNDRGTPVWAVNKNNINNFTIREIGPGADRFLIEEGGNIGIGTNNPLGRIHVMSTPLLAAVRADATGSGNVGVLGTSAGADGYALFGDATGNGGNGVYGGGPSSGYGVYCGGKFAATGVKSFQIDHPLDPAGHYLNHYCAEGPEPLNMYSGNAVLGPAGEAVVQLPAYFSSINRDFRYQLTCVGGYAPVYVGEGVTGNQFVIAGGRPGLTVSWRVEATRNDAWVRAYGAPVEEAKPAERQGTYLNPELYGRPPEEAQHARQKK